MAVMFKNPTVELTGVSHRYTTLSSAVRTTPCALKSQTLYRPPTPVSVPFEHQFALPASAVSPQRTDAPSFNLSAGTQSCALCPDSCPVEDR
ncbi:hypothetical protein DIPPA_17231 [Diplonema papillatum]|nr:hypothetical protein DIPPA_17231 [Diplonema papillatum]